MQYWENEASTTNPLLGLNARDAITGQTDRDWRRFIDGVSSPASEDGDGEEGGREIEKIDAASVSLDAEAQKSDVQGSAFVRRLSDTNQLSFKQLAAAGEAGEVEAETPSAAAAAPPCRTTAGCTRGSSPRARASAAPPPSPRASSTR